MANDVVLQVRDLDVSYAARRGRVRAVTDVSFDLHAGETLAFIGESGCGKSTLNLALMRLLPQTGTIDRGSIQYIARDGTRIDVLKLGSAPLRHFRWAECSMVFQGALNALNPVIRVSSMIYDIADAHGLPRKEAREIAFDLFESVKLDPARVFRSYPHELSGGMRQRVLLATSLLLRPQVVIMDEPTTAVDILTQRSILDVLKEMRAALQFSTIFISHDLAVAAEIADRIATMYAGNIVEIGPVDDVFYRPRHAYTLSLLNAAPRLGIDKQELDSIPGSPPDLIKPPPGCKFHPRCAFAVGRCKEVSPPLESAASGHDVACYESERVMKALRKGSHQA